MNHDLERGGAAALKLLDQVRQQIRVRHYSRRTEDSYVDWVRRFVLWHRKRRPRDMEKSEIEASLRHLAVECKVTFLGFTFRATKLRWSDAALDDFKHRIGELTRRSWGISMPHRLKKLAEYL